jgi:hypothetical protein
LQKTNDLYSGKFPFVRTLERSFFRIIAIGIAVILASFSLNPYSYAALSNSQKLKSNILACKKIINKSITFDKQRSMIPQDDYVQLRLVYRKQALFIDSFYYKTFGLVASAMGTLRDNIWQVADRSADMNRTLNTTQNPEEITGFQYAIDNSMSYISFDIVEFASACRSLKGFKYKDDIYTQESLNILRSFANRIGCLDFTKSSEIVEYVKEFGTCSIDNTFVKIYDFRNFVDQKMFLDALFAQGITADRYKISGTLVIFPDDASKLGAISL